jgi:prepilin signal peptidase PulO-like enzyme (type II secretory pathway)
MGDAKLMFSLGVFTGLSGISILLGLSALLSLPYSLYAKRHSASQTIPFGPFLVAGAMGAVILNTLTNSQVTMYF